MALTPARRRMFILAALQELATSPHFDARRAEMDAAIEARDLGAPVVRFAVERFADGLDARIAILVEDAADVRALIASLGGP